MVPPQPIAYVYNNSRRWRQTRECHAEGRGQTPERNWLNGVEAIEFNLKPKNLGVLKISLTLKQGLGQVKIITENSFVTNALQQNESLLQKLFNDQGINLDFTAHNGNQNSGSNNNFDHNEDNSKENKTNDTHSTEVGSENNDIVDIKNSSRHIVNVIA